jgi:hypothetical protein
MRTVACRTVQAVRMAGRNEDREVRTVAYRTVQAVRMADRNEEHEVRTGWLQAKLCRQ